MVKNNYDPKVIDDFGNEWKSYDQSSVDIEELKKQFSNYFRIFQWQDRITSGIGADFGCGTGRWAKFVADRVDRLICLDASYNAVRVAKRNLFDKNKCCIIHGRIDALPIKDNSLDFAYSLGVFHHLPDTGDAIKECAKKLKSGAPFLVYLYYAFDNRPYWYLLVWKLSDVIRKIISIAPFKIKYFLCNIISIIIYFPLARLSFLLEKLGINVHNIPLSEYRKKSFYTMRTDSLDRFGTKLEQRFTKKQIKKMMSDAGLGNIHFSNIAPYWCVIGYKNC